MIRKFVMSASAALFLAGCEVPVMIAADQNQGQMTGMFEITFPAVLLVRLENGEEELLNGSLIGHANGSARFNLTGPAWGECQGTASKSGTTSMSCSGGVEITMETGRQKARMSGVNVASGVHTGTGFVSAFGWGNDGNEAAVRAAIDTL